MTRIYRAAAALFVVPAVLLSGCLVTRRKLPVPIAPAVVQTVPASELVNRLEKNWSQLNSLSVTVEMRATVTKAKQGVSNQYPSIPGIILLRKPEMLRVYGRVPVVGTRLLDMVSDGKTFTLWIPQKSEAIEGPTTESEQKSTNQLENLRPGFFFDSMIVRGLAPGDEYYVTADTDTVEDAAKKHLYQVPEYLLNVVHRKDGSQELAPVRVIHFHRDDLLPYQQDLYDQDGNLQTQVYYGRYADYGENRYPSTITIKRPLEDLQLVLMVEKVTRDLDLKPEQFQLQIPEGTKIQRLH